MRRRTLTYSARSWQVRWPALRYWHDSFIRLRWPLRILGWLAAGSLAGLAGWQFIPLGPVVFEVGVTLTFARAERRVRGRSRPVSLHDRDPLAAAMRAEALRDAALPRVASPGGWSAPAGVRPAWNWTPPGSGVALRLDRVPLWARLWYHTPLLDRYAHAWLWYHGGWDVIPSGPAPSA
jgi:hypothetical protein